MSARERRSRVRGRSGPIHSAPNSPSTKFRSVPSTLDDLELYAGRAAAASGSSLEPPAALQLSPPPDGVGVTLLAADDPLALPVFEQATVSADKKHASPATRPATLRHAHQRIFGVVAHDFHFRRADTIDVHLQPCESVVRWDRLFESSIRVCDTRQYCDTLTLCGDLLRTDTENTKEDKFLRVMRMVTRGGFLRTPCRVQWNSDTKSWRWDEPHWRWLHPGNYCSLATFAALHFETVRVRVCLSRPHIRVFPFSCRALCRVSLLMSLGAACSLRRSGKPTGTRPNRILVSICC